MQGRLIVLEGIDHVGKSTLAQKLSDELQKFDYSVKLYQYPGKEEGTLGKLVYDIHHKQCPDISHPIDPLGLQYLHMAAHIDLLKRRILPEIEMGRWIILDRCWWSTLAYGVGDGLSKDSLLSALTSERELFKKITDKKYFYIVRDSRSHDFSREKEQKILDEYEKIFSAVHDGDKYRVNNNKDIQTAANFILQSIMDNY